MSIEPQAIRVQMPHMTMRGLQWGAPDAARVIISLHGWLDNAMSFSRLAPLLVDEETRVIAFDLAGHGLSDHRPLRSGYHFTDYLRDLYLALEQLDIQTFEFVCHSLGAAIATIYAGSFPEQVQRFVAIECYGVPLVSDNNPLPERMAERLPKLDVMRSRSETVYPQLKPLIRARRQAGEMLESSAELLLRRNLDESKDGFRFISDRRLTMGQPMLMSEAQLAPFLKRISAEVLVIEAEDGLMPHWQFLPGRYAITPNITVKRLPGGHHLHLDDPSRVAEVIHSEALSFDRAQ
ncbi:alpha/beta hydrolase [Suttonella sp. R2A3]|uniref:alpha/beta fold hydrolase n=1 Tax=Suttonella sp. R2A3 TaxID=2908648 RepID=UPI001F318216|nr:alpha/beta hydrolase [Suttonella sp. R2A3]UJF25086.1 alpha/beta hydrolase [Suttonella sp. R2A3]